ncbi:hypothetical protein KDL44_14325 [bacterium]|nr:hypothetical protein [bacterium]
MKYGLPAMLLPALAALLMLLLSPGLAIADTEFLNDKAFQFGMSQKDAAELLYGEKHAKDWEIAYDVATRSTWEIACRHHEEVQYVVRFYEGRCIYVEKRSEMEGRDMEKAISKLFDTNGNTSEAAGNTAESQFFARWTRDERSMELMAMRRRGGKFLLSYQDAELGLVNEAMLVRDRELKEGRMVIDPLTGKAVLHVQSGEQQAEGEGESGSGDEAQPEPERNKDPDKA